MTKQFLVIAALALVVRVWMMYTLPLPLSGDEIAHGNYIGYIHDHREIPNTSVANEFLPDAQAGYAQLSYEYYQPPGYYIIAAIFSGGQPIGARWVSVFMLMIALCFVWAATRDRVVVCALALVPGIVINTSIISNDVFLLLGSAITFYACQRKQTWAFVLGGLILATAKLQGSAILLALGIYYLSKRNFRWGLIGLAFAAVAGGIVWWRWDLQVENRGFQLFVPTINNVAKALKEILATGFLHPSYDLIPLKAIIPAALGGLILVYLAIRRWRNLPKLNKYVVLAVGLVAGGWFVFKLYPAGRYLYAAIPWLAMINKKKPTRHQIKHSPGKPKKLRRHR